MQGMEIFVLAAVFFVAALYSSVGHGGASGYLAVLSFYALNHIMMASGALVLNLLVAGISFSAFFRASHFSWRLTWPFIVSSMPAAFIGGTFAVSREVYSALLALVFSFAVFRLWFSEPQAAKTGLCVPSAAVSASIGGLVGLLSGIVGVGGGIFLSPLLVLLKWADAKRIAATSAFFIWANSFSGLLGRLWSGQFELPAFFLPVLAAAFAGSLIGSGLGASVFSPLTIRRALALVLLVAAIKLMP